MMSRVARVSREFGYRPLEEQELLLRAALLHGADALTAWDAWHRRVDFDAMDIGSVRLLPLLYRNLTEIGITSPLVGRIRGTYRKAWYENHLLIGHVADVLRRFAAAGIDTMLLKGIPLSLQYYETAALRPMADADLLIPAPKWEAALALVVGAGWFQSHDPREWPPRFTASRSFAHPLGIELDLHCHVLHECLGEGADDDFWRGAIPLNVGGVPTKALHPSDQLLHVIAHGFRRSTVPPVRWVADATLVIRAGGNHFDWDRVVVQARKRRLTRIVGSALRYLASRLEVPVPGSVLGALDRTPVSVTERLEHWTRSSRPGALPMATEHLCAYVRAKGRDPDWRGIPGLVRYTQARLGLASPWLIPAAAWRRAVRRRRH